MGQLLINQSLPEDLRDHNRVLDKKGVQQLLDTVARKYPEKYAEIAKNLSDVGRKVAYHSGGFGVGLESLRQTQAAKIARINLSRDLQQVYSNRTLTPEQTDAAVLETVGKYQQALPGDVFKEAVAANNPLALQAVSGARGSQTNVNSLIGADLLYEDHRGRPVPIPILRNYSMGLSPAEHFAGAFGARKGTLDLKKATADAGFLCLCENTEVRMADFSIKKIKDIVVGDWVLGADMQGMTFPVRVTAVFNNGDRELHTFVFRYGKSRTRTVEITATTAHKALARYRCISRPRQTERTHIRTVDKFQLGDMLNKSPRRHSLIVPQGFVDAYPMKDEPLAWVIGLLIGDGGLTQHHISLSAGDTRVVDLVRQQLEPLGFSVRKIKGHDCEYCISDNAKGSVQGVRQRYPVNRLWRRLSELDLRGCTASQKQLPAEVTTWSNASVARLLQGIMSSDGCVSRSNNSTVPTVNIAMTSVTLVNQIAELLAIRFGIYGQLSDVRTKGRAVTRFPERGYTANHDLRKLVINDRESVLKFTEIIGSDGDRGDRLTEKTAAIAAASRLDKFGFHFLRSVVVGIGNTMDLEVDHPDHLFVLANGAIVSNSKQLAQSVHRLLVTAHDSDSPYDESQPRGLEVSTDDADNEGSLLAHPVGGYGRNTVLTPKILKELRAAGHDNILVRSPTVGGPDDGGVYARDAGYREKGGLAPRGDMVGLAGSQAISEPVTQGQISSKHCLKRGTMVRMADWTVKAIEDIVVGDTVLGADRTGMTFPVRVVNVFDNGLRECVSTFFKYPFNRAKRGITLESTADHKVLMQRKVTNSKQESRNHELQILPVGTPTGSLCAVLSDGYQQQGGISEPFAIMAGLLLGDGCYTASVNSVNFSCFDELLATDPAVTIRLAALNLKLTKLTGHEGYYKVSMLVDDQSEYKDERGRVLPLTRNPARQWLERRDMYGKYAHEKTLPPDVATWDIQSICELIGGYFVTDGSVYYPTDHAHRGKPYFEFGSTSEAMLLQLRDLLVQRLGIYPTGPYGTVSGDRKRPMYCLNINTEDGIRKFYAAIPLYGIKKQRAAAMMASWVVERPRRYYRLPRSKPVAIGLHPTHDIEVDHPDHLFVLANGLIVSNSGGVAGASAGAIGGFAAINAMVQAPEIFPGGAVHSQMDGRVEHIVEAPQGGHYMTVGGQQHYIPRGATMTVQKGDTVEAGDTVTEGIPNPSEIVRHKGVGEGRRYFIDSFRKVLKNSQIGAHRRNVELLARGLLNHVRLTDEVGDWGPDDVVPYQTLESQWSPRPGYMVAPAKSLIGHYLERPILHYSVGTKIRPSMVQKLDQYGVKSIYAHRDAPPFEPEMVRAMMNTAHDPDWQTKMLGSYQQSSVLEAARRGGMSDNDSTSYVPSLASSPTFGAAKIMKGWNPADIGRTPVDLTTKPKITSLLD